MDIELSAHKQDWTGPLPDPSTFSGLRGKAGVSQQSAAPRSDVSDASGSRVRDLMRDVYGCGPDGAATRLETMFPHILRRLEALWGTDDMYRFLDSLTPGQRASCAGFPPEVEWEIQRLQSAYRSRYPEKPGALAGASEWELVPQAPRGLAASEPEPDIWKNERHLRR